MKMASGDGNGAQTQRSPDFRFNPNRAAEAIDFLARARPGLTQYFVGKLLYMADKAHLLDWGRPITFDRYVAMEHGPVPSAVRNMLQSAARLNAGGWTAPWGDERSWGKALGSRVRVDTQITHRGDLLRCYSIANSEDYEHLSGSDLEALTVAVQTWKHANFGLLREETHKDDAWAIAWAARPEGSRVYPIDLAHWAPEQERDDVRRYLEEIAPVAV